MKDGDNDKMDKGQKLGRPNDQNQGRGRVNGGGLTSYMLIFVSVLHFVSPHTSFV